MMLTVSRGRYEGLRVPTGYVVHTVDYAHSILIGDADAPGVAETFGWCPCDCGATDGTVDCAHRTAEAMLAEAINYLDSVADMGATAEDPGYVGEDPE